MPGCLNGCFMYWESHSLENVDDSTQVDIEQEIEKYNRGETCDLSLVRQVVRKTCLGSYLKDPSVLPTKCKHYKFYPKELKLEERINNISKAEVKKWRRITGVVSILGILITLIFGYLNFTKPTEADLNNKVLALKREIETYEKAILQKDALIDSLEKQLHQSKGEKANE